MGDDDEWLRFETAAGALSATDFVAAATRVAALGKGGLIVNRSGEALVRISIHLPSLVDLTLLFDCCRFVVETAFELRRDFYEAARQREAQAKTLCESSFFAEFLASLKIPQGGLDDFAGNQVRQSCDR